MILGIKNNKNKNNNKIKNNKNKNNNKIKEKTITNIS
jgi:hypothetical protein